MKNALKYILIGFLFAATPMASAWNIICGISVAVFKAASVNSKWEADTAAIRAMAEFYSAIAELQSINVEILLKKNSDNKQEKLKVMRAIARFKASNSQLDLAAERARELMNIAGPADSMGNASLKFWKELYFNNEKSIKALESNQLPLLEDLHEAIELTQRIQNLGIRASLTHLGAHKEHHTAGGVAAKF